MEPLYLHGIDVQIEVGATIAAVVAAVGGLAALWQYVLAARWKRAEFSVAQVRLLATEPTLAFCCRAIDWGVGPLIIPEKYRVMFPSQPPEARETVAHDWKLMAAALRPTLDGPSFAGERQAQFLLYRYAFDELFGYLDAIATYRRYGVVTEEDIGPINDYVRQLRHPLYWYGQIPGLAAEQVFGDFAQAFYGARVWPWMQRVDRLDAERFRSGGDAPPHQNPDWTSSPQDL